jgi:D-3-phosphoglycerate dehydrogenase
MRVVAWSRSLDDERAAVLGVERLADPLDVARESDVVSVHVALKPETRGLIGSSFFDAMKAGAYFVNTSRGEVIDQDALRRAMRERGIRAGLDVYAAEPTSAAGEFTDDIAREPNLYGTHHIGASTEQAQEAIAAETVRIIRTFKETGRVPNVVNLARRTPSTHTLVVRHRDRPGVLASVLDRIRAESINVQEMENIIFEGSEAAVARINLESAPPIEALEQLKASNEDIIELSLLEIRQ